MCLCCLQSLHVIYFPNAMARYSLAVCAESAVKLHANKQNNNWVSRYTGMSLFWTLLGLGMTEVMSGDSREPDDV